MKPNPTPTDHEAYPRSAFLQRPGAPVLRLSAAESWGELVKVNVLEAPSLWALFTTTASTHVWSLNDV
jgi:hypothetical protein